MSTGNDTRAHFFSSPSNKSTIRATCGATGTRADLLPDLDQLLESSHARRAALLRRISYATGDRRRFRDDVTGRFDPSRNWKRTLQLAGRLERRLADWATDRNGSATVKRRRGELVRRCSLALHWRISSKHVSARRVASASWQKEARPDASELARSLADDSRFLVCARTHTIKRRETQIPARQTFHFPSARSCNLNVRYNLQQLENCSRSIFGKSIRGAESREEFSVWTMIENRAKRERSLDL